MASKTNENYQRNSSAEANQTLAVAPITTNEDSESIKGKQLGINSCNEILHNDK